MKTCAKKRGVSTADLLDMIHARKEGGLPQMQADLKSFRVSDSDFKRPPARRSRKRARAAATEEAKYVTAVLQFSFIHSNCACGAQQICSLILYVVWDRGRGDS